MKKNPIETIYQPPRVLGYSNLQDSESISTAIDSYDSVQHSLSYLSHYDNLLPGQSGRRGFTREDYEYFRPAESLPRKYHEIVQAIDTVYFSLAIVRNIIDLMSDFACEGVSVVHPVGSIQKFYQEWFRKVGGPERSERFLSGLYRHGMVVAEQMNGRVKQKKFDQMSFATDDIKLEKQKVFKNTIPLKYIFHNPAYFTHTNYHEINQKPEYILKVPQHLYSDELFGRKHYFATDDERTLDPLKTSVCYYKKDDWCPKPSPFLYPVIKHAMMLEKLSLADAAALDGAINKIRIFKIGHLDSNPNNHLFPSDGVIEKLDSILQTNVAGGVKDIIWGPDIELIESDTNLYQFLGEEKYVPHISQVYEGLGIPTSFVGVGQGTTNNYISLKIMMRRLMSGRERLIEFWNHQMKQVQWAMGFAEPAYLEFNQLELGDEESERQLLIQLLDRQIVSEERVLNILGFDPRMEFKRVRKENRERASGRRPDKAGQFHNGEKEFTLKKTSLEKGYWAPEHLGLEKEGGEDIKSPHEDRMEEIRNRQKQIDNGVKGGAGGRPKGAKDTVKRKEKEFRPAIKASQTGALDVWLNIAQDIIADTLKEIALSDAGKKNLRELTVDQVRNFENVKFGVLSNIEPFESLSEKVVFEALKLPGRFGTEFIQEQETIKNHFGRSLSLEEIRIVQKNVYKNNLNFVNEDEDL